MDGLEARVKLCTQENRELQKKVESLQKQNVYVHLSHVLYTLYTNTLLHHLTLYTINVCGIGKFTEGRAYDKHKHRYISNSPFFTSPISK